MDEDLQKLKHHLRKKILQNSNTIHGKLFCQNKMPSMGKILQKKTPFKEKTLQNSNTIHGKDSAKI
jgi:hypothetical protein